MGQRGDRAPCLPLLLLMLLLGERGGLQVAGKGRARGPSAPGPCPKLWGGGSPGTPLGLGGGRDPLVQVLGAGSFPRGGRWLAGWLVAFL